MITSTKPTTPPPSSSHVLMMMMMMTLGNQQETFHASGRLYDRFPLHSWSYYYYTTNIYSRSFRADIIIRYLVDPCFPTCMSCIYTLYTYNYDPKYKDHSNKMSRYTRSLYSGSERYTSTIDGWDPYIICMMNVMSRTCLFPGLVVNLYYWTTVQINDPIHTTLLLT